MSLAEAVALGLRDNRTIRSAYLERVAQKFDLVVARSQYLPRLNLVGGVFRDRIAGTTSTTTTLAPVGTWLSPTGATAQFSWAKAETRGDLRGTTETSRLTVTQPLLRGAGLAVNLAPLRIATLQEQINQLQLKATVADTVTAIVLGYRSLLQAQEQVRLARSSLERSTSLLATNQALIDAGRMAAADILQTRADVASQQLVLIQAEQQRATARLALLRLLALDLRTNIVAADPIEPQPVVIDLSEVIALALSSRMDVLAQRKALAQDREVVRVARNNRLWDVSVVASVRHDATTGAAAALAQTSSEVGVQLSIPLGDYSKRQEDIRATTSLRVDEVRLEDLGQAVEAEVRDAVQGVDAAWRQLLAAREARALASQALGFAREKLQAGRASNFEVLSFEAGLRAAENQELAAGVGYLNALTTLDQQVGGTLATWRIDLND
ncbi:TolC family protein [Phenylobacterium sp.]|uniref:TolC family protein n=1 Tax=Phenylobacterium sp. TaxID=1871053 RepID=UPI0025FF171E|nr:TolC family protein [Phenylobacterium sp.]